MVQVYSKQNNVEVLLSLKKDMMKTYRNDKKVYNLVRAASWSLFDVADAARKDVSSETAQVFACERTDTLFYQGLESEDDELEDSDVNGGDIDDAMHDGDTNTVGDDGKGITPSHRVEAEAGEEDAEDE